MSDFIAWLFSGPSDFLMRLSAFARRIAPAGAANGLAQTLIKFTAPGVPDIYQGTEYWDFSLVDPDNRAPVDFAVRQKFLHASAIPRIGELGLTDASNNRLIAGCLRYEKKRQRFSPTATICRLP